MRHEAFWDVVRREFGGRRWILAQGPLAAHTPWIRALREVDAGPFLVLADVVGTGEVPQGQDVEHVLLGTDGAGIMESIRAYERRLGALSEVAQVRVDTFDPTHAARVFASFLVQADTVGGRQRLAPRPAHWALFENKCIIDAYWPRWGVPAAPARVVGWTQAPLVAAELDRGDGTVWSVEDRNGFAGGGTRVRWIRTPLDVASVHHELSMYGDRVRIMPFLPGIPCSVHGVVCARGVAVFRPFEQLVLRRTGGTDFLYAGVASYWDPPAAARDEMRAAARRVGMALRELVSFRGGFTLDGILTVDGFRPTELNPRPGAGFAALADAAPDVPIGLLEPLIRAGRAKEIEPSELEESILGAADDVRVAAGTLMLPGVVLDEDRYVALAWRDGRWAEATDDEAVAADLDIGPGPCGAMVRLRPRRMETPVGEPWAPRVEALVTWLDEMLETDLGPVYAAEAV